LRLPPRKDRVGVVGQPSGASALRSSTSARTDSSFAARFCSVVSSRSGFPLEGSHSPGSLCGFDRDGLYRGDLREVIVRLEGDFEPTTARTSDLVGPAFASCGSAMGGIIRWNRGRP